jgi:hypothetical protein
MYTQAWGYSVDHESITVMPLGKGREGQNKSDTCLLLRFESDLNPYMQVIHGPHDSGSMKTSMLTALLCKESDQRICEMFRPHTIGENFQFRDISQDWDQFAAALSPKEWRPEEWCFEAFGEDADVKAHELEPFQKNLFMFFNDFKMKLYTSK